MIKRLIKYSLGIICFLGMSAILNQQVFADSDILNSNYVDIFSKIIFCFMTLVARA